MATALSVRFLCGLRGYHVYQREWTPILNEVLPAIHDCYAIAARKRLPGQIIYSTVGHLPKEISRVTRFIMLYGATVTIKIKDVNHRRSPLIQGGLEIPVEVIIQMDYSEKNEKAMAKYSELVSQNYQEPVNEKFEDITRMVLNELYESDSSQEDDYSE